MTTEGNEGRLPPALDRLAAELAAAEQTLGDSRRRPRPLLLAVAALALLIAASFTPPGRVVAGEVGNFVGIGDEPTVTQHAANELDAVVIGTGAVPGGEPFEIVATHLEGPRENGVCINLDIPKRGKPFNGLCLNSDVQPLIDEAGFGRVSSLGSPRAFRESDLVVSGLVRPGAAGVEVTYRTGRGVTKTAPVAHAVLTDDLRAAIGAGETVGGFFAFLPRGVVEASPDRVGAPDLHEAADLLRSVEVVALDDEGAPLAQAKVYQPEFDALQLTMKPPARFAPTMKARQAAIAACREEGITGKNRALDPEEALRMLKKTVDPEQERCIRRHLAADRG